MIISGHVPSQYSDIVTGINALIASGVASGDITEFYLYVDDSYYTGVFSASVPNSGSFFVVGNGTYFAPQDTCTIYTEGDGSFNFINTDIIGEDTSNWLFNVSGISDFTIDKSSVIYPLYGILSQSGTVNINNSYIAGSGAGTFYSGNIINFDNSDISLFNNGIYSNECYIGNSHFIDNTIAIESAISGIVSISDTLIHDANTAVKRAPYSSISIENCTINAIYPINGSGGTIGLYESILDANDRCINGFLDSGSVVNDCGLYPTGWLAADVTNEPSYDNLSYSEPKFNNPTYGDYRLQFDYVDGSPFVEHVSKNVPSDVTLRSEISNIILSDSRGIIEDMQIQQFLYKQGSTISLSDYNKEIEFAHFIKAHNQLSYTSTTQARFSVYEQTLKSCFSSNSNHPQPFDWDLRRFNSPEIFQHENDYQYIIPRTYLDLKPIVISKLGFIGDAEFRFDRMTEANVKVYNQQLSRGIAYDFGLSSAGNPYIWRLEGRNQLLIKQNAFTQEDEKIYPLLAAELRDNTVIQPSGLVYMGPIDDRFRFVSTDNPNNEYIAENKDGYFKWIDTTLDKQFDARGILAYKNNLYITGSRYSDDIYDRTTLPSLDSVGYIIRYYNDTKLSHYLTSLDSLGNRRMTLHEDNTLPTDITVYEDGNLFVADYANSSGLFRYKFAYDYAILNEQYDRLSKIWLREFYPTVNF